MLRDQEDNLFLSRDYGRAVDREKYWFHRGGMTIQSNLLFNDLVYLQRGESERAIRMLFNNFAQNLYRDVNCFSEHPITDFGLGFGPFFKTPDEAQFIVNLRNHLLREAGNTLYLLQGTPRAWFEAGKAIRFDNMATFFGPVSLSMRAEESAITLTVSASWRSAPEEIALYLRTPKGRPPVQVWPERRADLGRAGGRRYPAPAKAARNVHAGSAILIPLNHNRRPHPARGGFLMLFTA